jgi:asparagine synthase (glutamine-hydrolysing)
MCGIAGAADSGQTRDVAARVRAMLDAMRHRGPDASAVQELAGCEGRRIALGAVRLRIIDLDPVADQPIANADESVWVACNGEIYNFRELRAELIAAGYEFRSNGDTECIVHLYRHVGGDVARLASRLRGMFAIAIWDVRLGRLSLVRDRLGIKPLHWVRTVGGIAFCSEQRPLAGAGAGFVSGAPSLTAIAGLLTKGAVPHATPALEGIRRLGPGELLTWDGADEVIARWWKPAFAYRADLLDRDAARSDIASVFDGAVARHLVADRPTGVFLSSGVDSSAIATVAARSGAQKSLTVRFPDDPASDEGQAAEATARALGFEHIAVPVTGSEVRRLLPEFVRSLDSPSADGLNTWLVCRAAREAGLVVALSGLGGDELFAGYRTFKLVPRLRAALSVITRVPRPARRLLASAMDATARTRPLARALTDFAGMSGAYHATRAIFQPHELADIGLPAPHLVEVAAHMDPLDAVTLLELQSYLLDQLLADSDSTSMAHSIEIRVPLLDDEVIEAALSLPPPVRRQGKNLLADAVGLGQRAAKRPFALPFASWLSGPLCDTFRDAVLDDALPLGDVLPSPFRRQLWQQFDSGRAHWSKVWAIGMLRMWPGANGLRW